LGLIVALLLPVSFLRASFQAPADPGAEATAHFGPFRRIHIVPIEGTIDSALAESIDRRVEIAREAGADCIVFDIDTYGGEVFAADRITRTIFPLPDPAGGGIHTIAFVTEKAISAGVLIAMSCREIYMSYGSRMGDCEPIMVSPGEGILTAPEKIQSPLRAEFRKFAERNGYPVAIAEAMVTKELGVAFIRFEGETEGRYYSVIETEAWPEEKRERIAEQRILVRKGELPTFTFSEAEDLGLSRGTLPDRDALIDRISDEGAIVALHEITWSEEMVRFLQQWKFLLFVVGVIGLYLEFKAPGFGAPGIVGILALALFFFSSYLSGLAEVWEILVFVLGVVLLAVEIFVLPGFGIPGVLGIFLILLSFYLASQPFVIPGGDPDSVPGPFEMGMLHRWLVHFGLSLVAAFVAIAILARMLPRTPIYRRLVLAPVPASGGATVDADVSRVRLGAEGVTLTQLRPAGKARFGDDRLAVVTEGDYLEAGVRVRVVSVQGNRIVVQRIIS
jgi:membrane-bound serine protease (ClpP class)